MSCRYDREKAEYLNDGEPCVRDEYGDPTTHCTATRSCAHHVGPGELTCARCLGRCRANLRRITPLTALTSAVVATEGVDSEALNIAGPGVDPRGWEERRLAMRRHITTWASAERITEDQAIHALEAMDENDNDHPFVLITRWHSMLAGDYGHDLPTRMSLADSTAYIDRHLGRIAQDDGQDFPLMAREIRKCRNHLERVLRTAESRQRGAPCPDCTTEETGVGPRLVREYGHWCDDEACCRVHVADDSMDRWVCPRDRDHVRTLSEYANYIEERQAIA